MQKSELEEIVNNLYNDGDECPACEDGVLVMRYARNLNGRDFLGCSNYPRCGHTEPF